MGLAASSDLISHQARLLEMIGVFTLERTELLHYLLYLREFKSY